MCSKSYHHLHTQFYFSYLQGINLPLPHVSSLQLEGRAPRAERLARRVVPSAIASYSFLAAIGPCQLIPSEFNLNTGSHGISAKYECRLAPLMVIVVYTVVVKFLCAVAPALAFLNAHVHGAFDSGHRPSSGNIAICKAPDCAVYVNVGFLQFSYNLFCHLLSVLRTQSYRGDRFHISLVLVFNCARIPKVGIVDMP